MSGGWVRCGQCTEVFDATQTLASSPTEFSAIESFLAVAPDPITQEPPAFLVAADTGLKQPHDSSGVNTPLEPFAVPSDEGLGLKADLRGSKAMLSDR